MTAISSLTPTFVNAAFLLLVIGLGVPCFAEVKTDFSLFEPVLLNIPSKKHQVTAPQAAQTGRQIETQIKPLFVDSQRTPNTIGHIYIGSFLIETTHVKPGESLAENTREVIVSGATLKACQEALSRALESSKEQSKASSRNVVSSSDCNPKEIAL